jgi:festuclavine dehydrogenase
MTILITGSSGKTASHLAQLLAPTISILVASRRPKQDAPHPTVQFDWLDESTYPHPFSHAVAQKSPISAVYLVSPDISEARASVMKFVKFATSRGAKRFVLLSAWENEAGGAFMGAAHAELKGMGDEGLVEWAVLRPHFFMGQ